MKSVESKKDTENMFDVYSYRGFSELEYTFQPFSNIQQINNHSFLLYFSLCSWIGFAILYLAVINWNRLMEVELWMRL